MGNQTKSNQNKTTTKKLNMFSVYSNILDEDFLFPKSSFECRRGNSHLKTFSRPRELRTTFTETYEAYLAKIEVPGVKKEEIGISVENDVLTVEVRSNEQEAEEKSNKSSAEEKVKTKQLWSDRLNFSGKRSFKLLKDVDVSKISASLSDGILLLTIGKLAEDLRVKKIAIL